MKSKTFCVFPFFNLNSNTDGSIKLCCNIRENIHVKDSNGQEFNLGKDSIDDIWNSGYMNRVRLKMYDGFEVDECRDCYKHEETSGSSSRTSSNEFWLKKEHVLRNIENFRNNRPLEPVSSLELRLGNTCNLSCNSCWGYSSSKSNEEKIQLLKKEDLEKVFRDDWAVENNIPKTINHWFKTDQYKDNIQSVSKNVNRIYITGGEPTLIKENRTLLQNLLDNGNSDCFVSFTTNGTQADGELLNLIKQFPNNEIQISIDAVGDQAHYVRYPIVWDEFKSNVDKLCAIPSVNIVFYTVINAYNLFSISDIIKYIDEIAAKRKVGWYPIFLDNPIYMHTHIWPITHRQAARDQYIKTVNNLQNLLKYNSLDTFKKVEDYYLADRDFSQHRDTFIKFNAQLDSVRGTNYYNTFKELAVCLT